MNFHKRVIGHLFVFLLLTLSQLAAAEFDKGILWQITKPGYQASYVLGTIHSDDPKVTNVPAAIQAKFKLARSFTAELDLNMSSMLAAQQQMLLPDGQNLQSLIGAQRYSQCVALLQNYGVPEMIVDRMKPWAIATQLSMPKPTSGIFLDLQLYQQAQQRGIPVHGLETVSEQMSVFTSMTTEQQLMMLDQAIKDYPQLSQYIGTLTQLYLQRDLQGMQRFSDEQMKKIDPRLAQTLETNLVVKRNHRMVERMQPRLKEGGAFIAVGSLHLPGKQGILALLKQQGYQLTRVY